MWDCSNLESRDRGFINVLMETLKRNMGNCRTILPNMELLFDCAACNQKEVYETLEEEKVPLYYNEKPYFDQICDGLHTTVYDLSGNCLPSYIQSVTKIPNATITADNTDSLERYGFMQLLTDCQNCQTDLNLDYPRSTEELRAERSERFDNMRQDIDRILHPRLPVMLRISLTGSIHEAGCTMEDLPEMFEKAKSLSIPINTITLQCNKASDVSFCLDKLEVAVEIAKEKGASIQKMVITGEGIQKLAKENDSLSKMTINRLCSMATEYSIAVDVSRWLIDDVYIIYSPIIGKKKKSNDELTRILYYTDNGVYCSFYHKHMYSEKISPIPIRRDGTPISDSDCLYKTTIFGPTCDSIDCLGNDFSLPELEIGDWLKYENCGYKCSVNSTRFNGFMDPDVFIV